MPGTVSTSAALENTKCCFGSFFDAMSGTESDSHSSSVGMQDISPRGPTLNHPFRITNQTGQPVHIASVRVSCGCVSANALKDDLAGKYALSREDQASIPADEAERMAKELLDIFAVVCDPRAFRSLGWKDWGVRTA